MTVVTSSDRLRAHVEALCAPAMSGRAPGTEGSRLAQRYLADELEDLGLSPVGGSSFLHAIPPIDGANIVGSSSDGTGQARTSIVLGAHYDHLGTIDGDVYPGADDNASGVAVALEAARHLREQDAELDLILCLFDAEEPPHFLGPTMGSRWFVSEPPLELSRIAAMVCLDIVGHALGPAQLPASVRDSVLVFGAERSSMLRRGLDAAEPDGMLARRIDEGLIFDLSDFASFRDAGVPTLFYTSGRTPSYHTPADIPDLLDFDWMARLVYHLVDVIGELRSSVAQRDFQIDARDDARTLQELLEMFRTLSPLERRAASAVVALEELESRRAAAGSLTPDERFFLTNLLFGLEEWLLGS